MSLKKIQNKIKIGDAEWDADYFLQRIQTEVELLPLNKETITLHKLLNSVKYQNHLKRNP